MDKRKVCMLSPIHQYHDTRVFYRTAKTLQNFGYNVTLFAKNKKKIEIIDNIVIKKTADVSNLFRFFYWFILFVRAIKEKADIYHLHNPDTIPIAICLKLFGKKVIYDTHEDFSQRILIRDWIPLFLRKTIALIIHKLEKKLGKICDSMIVTQEQLQKKIPGSVLIKNAPVIDKSLLAEVEKESKKIKKKEKMIIYAGHILSEKRGIKNMIKAVEYANKKVSIGFWLAGKMVSVSYYNELKAMSAWRYVDYLGFLRYEEAMAYTACADMGLAVIPDIADHQFASANKLYEYQTFGIPFISSDFRLWKKELEKVNSGYFVSPDNIQAIGEKIIHLSGSRKTAYQMGANGKKYIEKEFNWNIEGQKLITLYEDIL
ncbi:MAG: glycosyltransferase [Spirochaetia bacterium]|nr:glycosyltransferase [Spirochaetia bacterium]